MSPIFTGLNSIIPEDLLSVFDENDHELEVSTFVYTRNRRK